MGIETLKFLQNALDYLQREAGVNFHLREHPNRRRYVSYLTRTVMDTIGAPVSWQ